MAEKLLHYKGADIHISYDLKKCIHAAECIAGNRSVFDPKRKPWIDPDAAEADEIAEVIHRCPSGALTYSRPDGGAEEQPPKTNTARVGADGPLYLRGNIEVRDHDGNVLSTSTRMALCRCGASSNKPFCDNSHDDSGFEHDGTLGRGGVYVENMVGDDGRVTITVADNAFLRIAGPLTIVGEDGEERIVSKATLCRCGASNNKPFCDSSHKEIGFTA